MNLSLRRARRLEMALRGLTIPGQVAKIRTYDHNIAKADLEDAIYALHDNIQDTLDLSDIRFDIRNKINEKNIECGIASILNRRDSLFEQRRILEAMQVPDDSEVQLKYLRQLSGSDTQLVVVRQSHVDEVMEQLGFITRDLDDISDELNQLNSDTEITIDAKDLELLKEKGLL